MNAKVCYCLTLYYGNNKTMIEVKHYLYTKVYKESNLIWKFTYALGVSRYIKNTFISASFPNALGPTIPLDIRVVIASQGGKGHKIDFYGWTPRSIFYYVEVWCLTKLWREYLVKYMKLSF